MSHFNASQFDDVISSFYEAAVQTRLWPAALEKLSQAVGAEGASLVERRADNTPGMVCSENVAELMDTFVRENWASRNYRFDRGIAVARRVGVVTEGMICSPTELDREPMQADFLKRFGLRWFAGLVVVSEPDAEILMSIDRPANREPFSRSEVALLRRLLPHIKRSGQLALASSSSLSSGMLRGLNEFGRAAMLLDGNGRVMEVNERAERLLGNGLRIAKGRLIANSRDADSAFQTILNAAVTDPQRQGAEPVVLPRALRPPLVAYVAPVAKSACEVFQRAKALVMFSDLEEKPSTPEFLLRQAFRLTSAEARIALSIARGDELRHAAEANGIAFETARVHLKAIFSKTQTHRQVQLALLIGRLGI